MVNEGVCNIREIERDIKRYVYYELFNNEDKPEFSNRRFYPCKKDIRNHFDLPSPNENLQRRIRTILNFMLTNGKLPEIPKTSSCLDLTLLQRNLGMKLAVKKQVKKNQQVQTCKRCWFCTKCLGKDGFYYVMDKTFAFWMPRIKRANTHCLFFFFVSKQMSAMR